MRFCCHIFRAPKRRRRYFFFPSGWDKKAPNKQTSNLHFKSVQDAAERRPKRPGNPGPARPLKSEGPDQTRPRLSQASGARRSPSFLCREGAQGKHCTRAGLGGFSQGPSRPRQTESSEAKVSRESVGELCGVQGRQLMGGRPHCSSDADQRRLND